MLKGVSQGSAMELGNPFLLDNRNSFPCVSKRNFVYSSVIFFFFCEIKITLLLGVGV